MRSTIPAYAAAGPDEPLRRTMIPLRSVGEHDILIEIGYTGICHTDIHQVREDWGKSIFPMVPGHEVAGIVVEVGSAVTQHAVGDRVGVGCFVDSCRECANCVAGHEQYCLRGSLSTYNALDRHGRPTFGGYSTHLVADENYVLRIPDGIGLAEAAPLLCAGISMYSPLRHWKAGPGSRVAVVGMGGLGHLGVKIGNALGADVTVLSQSLRKREDGFRLGATSFHSTADPATFIRLAGAFDLIVNTVSADLDLDAYLGLLAMDGTLVNIGVAQNPCTFGTFSLLVGRKSLAGSLIGGIRETQEMLDFCAARGLGAEVEVISADRINEAFRRLVAGEVRYRFVVDAASIASSR
ncbi:NAD(P)-dependent alcohol dehydrogenase [Nocardia iowensis]|uniref:alcohol dehydrogenase (NADP(+)) n=1 Tax=Nocardia iowensis TaxID=204891 RepID=A0ABX8RIC7_NOCIO|nr:NAD(P)-dependent alcohol dehydrogenase [Nocardia iowensis]QXN89377.1 NAD(P)-dependent alcohol dehydrogenase [Nocardia iowensis]